MSPAASLLMLAAATMPQAAKPAPPSAAEPVRHGAVASANATAVILRPAVIRFDRAAFDAGAQVRETIYRDIRRRGRLVSIEFN